METKIYKQKGEGTVTQRSDGRWETRITINGKRKCFYGKTEREVKKKQKEYQDNLRLGMKESRKIKVAAYFEEWLLNCKKGSLKASSYDRIERTYRNHIKCTVGSYQLGNLTTRDIQKLINCKSEVLSYSSTKKIYEALNSCLSYAEAVGDIERNPMRAVVLPKEHSFKVSTKDVTIPTREEMEQIIKTAFQKYSNGRSIYHLPYAYAIVLISNTGLRVGELLALTWDKIDFNTALVKIDCSVSEVLNRETTESKKRISLISDTKTKNGKRTVVLNIKALNALRAIQEYHHQNNIVSEYVICDTKGGMASYQDLKRTYDKVLKRAGIEPFGLHSIRHYFASVCIANKIGMFELSRMLGHGKVSVTMDIYGHLMEEQFNEMRNLLNVI